MFVVTFLFPLFDKCVVRFVFRIVSKNTLKKKTSGSKAQLSDMVYIFDKGIVFSLVNK